MLTINDLYKNVLSKLPFAIGGKVNIEREIFTFLKVLAESQLLSKDSQKLKFIMAGFAKIKAKDILNLYSLESWETNKLKSFFYYDYEEDDIVPLMSVYQSFLSELTDGKKNITNIICDNNLSGVNFRVKITSEYEKIRINYNVREHVLEGYIPSSFFIEDKRILYKEDYANMLVQRSLDNRYEFFRSNNTDDSEFKTLLSKILIKDVNLLKMNPKDYFLRPERLSDRLKDALANDSFALNEILFLFITAGCLSYLLDCNIEYFTSTANEINGKKHSLGSIAVGFKGEYIEPDLRSLFSIISNHVAMNLSTQILMDVSLLNKYIAKRKKFNRIINDFEAQFDLDMEHAEPKKGEYTLVTQDNIVELNKNKYSVNEIDSLFGEGMVEYLQAVLNNDKIDYGMYYGFHNRFPISKCLNKVYEYYITENCLGLEIKLEKNPTDPAKKMKGKPIINVYLPHLLISEILKDKKRKCTNVKTSVWGSSLLVQVDYKEKVLLVDLVRSITSTGKKGSFPNFLIKNLEAFLTCGDLVIKDKDDRFQISLKNDFKILFEKEKLISIEYTGNIGSIVNTKSIIFELNYNLF